MRPLHFFIALVWFFCVSTIYNSKLINGEFLINGKPGNKDNTFTVRPGEYLQLTYSNCSGSDTILIRDTRTNYVSYNGSCNNYKQSYFALRTDNTSLKISHTNLTGYVSTITYSIAHNLSFDNLYPGVWLQIKKYDPIIGFPDKTSFIVKDNGNRSWLDPKYLNYPSFRTAESYTEPTKDANGFFQFKTSFYYHVPVPYANITSPSGVESPIANTAGDLVNTNIMIRLSGIILIKNDGKYSLRLYINLKGKLRLGKKSVFLMANRNNTVHLQLNSENVPFEIIAIRGPNDPMLMNRWFWKTPGNKDFAIIPAYVFVHPVPRLNENIYRDAIGFYYRYKNNRVSDSGSNNDSWVYDFLSKVNDTHGASFYADNDDNAVRYMGIGISSFLSGLYFRNNLTVARIVMRIVTERVRNKRLNNGFKIGDLGRVKGATLAFYQDNLCGFLYLLENIPELQMESINARAYMSDFIIWSFMYRNTFNEFSYYTNDCYVDNENFIVNVWRNGYSLDNPYAFDAVLIHYDNLLNYANYVRQGVSSDGTFFFHNANGRQFMNYAYGTDYFNRVYPRSMHHKGTPWGYSPEMYRRLIMFTNVAEWTIYHYYKPFNGGGRLNGKREVGKKYFAPDYVSRAFVSLPEKLLYPEDYIRMNEMRRRVNNNPLNTIKGNHFFHRNLFMVHRRDDYYIELKMIQGMSGGTETFRGYFPWDMAYSDGLMLLERNATEYDDLLRNAPNAAYGQLKNYRDGKIILPWKANTYSSDELSQWLFRSLPGEINLDNEIRHPDRYRSPGGPNSGGVTDGRYGSCGFYYKNGYTDTSHASFYAFLEDGVVRMANSIQRLKSFNPNIGNDTTMRTNLNYCSWWGDVTIYCQNGTKILLKYADGDKRIKLPLTQRYYVLHSEIGYLLMPTLNEAGPGIPGVLDLNLSTRNALSPVPGLTLDPGYVEQLKKGGYDKRIVRVFHLSVDHTRNVLNGEVLYAVCMSDAENKTQRWLSNPPFKILANQYKMQSILDTDNNVTHVYLREPGELWDKEGKLIMSSRTPVILMWNANTNVLSVQDPQAVAWGNYMDTFNGVLGPGLDPRIKDEITVSVAMSGVGNPDDRYRGEISHKKIVL